jgi:ABC-type lipoprotein release transport system permease subunit
VSQFDVPSFAVTAAILTLATIAACFLPALRAIRIEPVRALRYE